MGSGAPGRSEWGTKIDNTIESYTFLLSPQTQNIFIQLNSTHPHIIVIYSYMFAAWRAHKILRHLCN